jgi:hexosaminidase
VKGGAPFVFAASSKVLDQGDFDADEHLKTIIRDASGISLDSGSGSKIIFRRANTGGEESYRLSVSQTEIVIEAAEDAGAFYAVQTLRQLLPADIEDGRTSKQLSIPQLEIEDEPITEWRGMMMDESRHFFGVEYTKRFIDWLALHKMNVFHWHLVDDGGWRMEVDAYPKLTSIGAWREDTGGVWPGGNWNFGNIRYIMSEGQAKPYGGFYSKEEIRDIVKYAADRHVTVVPEIEMPGHCLPATISYPYLRCDNVAESEHVGYTPTNVFCAGKESTFEFLETVLEETMELFPSEFIHIGADEVWKGHWENCDSCAKRMSDEDLADTHELQSWFVRRMERFLSKNGRRLIGWDEILEGGLAPGATVMSWRGVSGGIAAAKQGRDVIMSPTSHCYFDYAYNNISTEKVYGFNPIVDGLDTDEERSHILGGQANVWTEWISSVDRAEYMIFPRMIALAETLWTAEDQKSWPDFQNRLMPYFERLDALEIDYHPMNPALKETAILFDGSTTIDVPGAKQMPWALHWTRDGSDPTGDSPRYTKPLKVTKPGTYKFVYVMKSGLTSDIQTVDVQQFSAKPPSKLSMGLRMSAYTGTWDLLPDFSTLKPEYTVTVDGVGTAFKPQDDAYALLLKGWLKAPADGLYNFRIGSDDGSRLRIGGALIVDHDGPHGHTEKAGAIRLKKGLYPIRVEMFEIGGGDSLSLRWSGPGFTMKPINPEYLWH